MIAAIVVAVVIAAAGFWYWQNKKAAEAPTKPTDSGVEAGVEAKGGLGAEALNKAQNPLANELPATNPFEVNTNPFKDQPNPIDKTYQNPFE